MKRLAGATIAIAIAAAVFAAWGLAHPAGKTKVGAKAATLPKLPAEISSAIAA